MKKCAGFPSVAAMALAVLACSGADSGAANHDAGTTDGATGGTGGTTVSASCTAYEQTTDLHASCALVISDCPRTLHDFLESLAVDGRLPPYDVLELDGLVESGNYWTSPDGRRLSFTTEDGMLAGFHTWHDIPFGPCASSRAFGYQRGRLLSGDESARSCTLAADALETGVLCAEE